MRELTSSELDQVAGGVFNNVAGVGVGANGTVIAQVTQVAALGAANVIGAIAGASGVA